MATPAENRQRAADRANAALEAATAPGVSDVEFERQYNRAVRLAHLRSLLPDESPTSAT